MNLFRRKCSFQPEEWPPDNHGNCCTRAIEGPIDGKRRTPCFQQGYDCSELSTDMNTVCRACRTWFSEVPWRATPGLAPGRSIPTPQFNAHRSSTVAAGVVASLVRKRCPGLPRGDDQHTELSTDRIDTPEWFPTIGRLVDSRAKDYCRSHHFSAERRSCRWNAEVLGGTQRLSVARRGCQWQAEGCGGADDR